MRLNFSLNKINLNPTCHLQILRHAQQYQNKYATGLLYGALYDNQAEVTNIMPYPDTERTSKEELTLMEKRHQDHINKFNLDSQNLGWYFVSYKRNFWDEIQLNSYFQKHSNTSFFLVFDYKARLYGTNPYRAFRLKDQFAVKDSFKWSDLINVDLKENNPFIQIPVKVKKNEIFEFLMHHNKKRFINELDANSKNQNLKKNKGIRTQIQDYMQAFEELSDIQKYMNDTYSKNIQDHEKLSEKAITPNEFYEYLGQALKLQKHQKFLKNYQKSIGTYQKVFEKN